MLSPEDQARFNFRMLRAVAEAMCESFAEIYGYKPYRGPSLGAIHFVAKLTIPLGPPETEEELRRAVREVMRRHAPPIGLN